MQQASAAFFDDLELLAAMLRLHQADRLQYLTGEQLMQELGGSIGDEAARAAFVRLVSVAAEDELIGFEVIPPMARPHPRPDEYEYLQSMRSLRLRTRGLDRARGQRVAEVMPEPGQDDGRRIPVRALERVADAVAEQLRGDEVRSFLLDSGVPESQCPAVESCDEAAYLRAVLDALMDRGASGRRVVRELIGRWLSDELEVGPTMPQRAALVEILSRTGWKVSRSTLVVTRPSRPTRYAPSGTGQAPAARAHSSPEEQTDPERARRVMVVYGRDYAASRSLFDFLRAVGLDPQEWESLVAHTGSGAPYTGQVLDRALEVVQAVVVLFTPDDEARLAPELVGEGDSSDEAAVRGQPRPNVLYEAGLAFGRHPDRTILVELGSLRGVSDLAGRHTVRLERGVAALHDLAERLRTAGCDVSTTGSSWLDTTRFVARSATPPDGLAGGQPRDGLFRLIEEILEAALQQEPQPDVTSELTRRVADLKEPLLGDELFERLPGRRLSIEQMKKVTYDLFDHGVLARNPDGGRGWVKGDWPG